MTKYICAVCKKDFDDDELAFEHVIETHGDVIESEYIIEDTEYTIDRAEE